MRIEAKNIQLPDCHYIINRLLKIPSIAASSGLIDGELWVVETADPRNVIAIIGFEELMGKYDVGGDFEMGLRIESAYDFAGRILGDYVRRKS